MYRNFDKELKLKLPIVYQLQPLSTALITQEPRIYILSQSEEFKLLSIDFHLHQSVI